MEDRVRAAFHANDAPYGVALFNVDLFSPFRLAYGQAHATEIIERLERSLRACLPPERLLLERAGEDSFVAIFPGASLRESAALADRMRFATAAQELRLPGVGTVALSLSAGVVAADGFTPGDELLRSAQASLVIAKRSGRNCIAANGRIDLDRDARALQQRHAWHPGRAQQTFGRAAELSALGLLFANERFITLAGPGGVGKTHLALAAANQFAARFPDGIFLIDASEATCASSIQHAIAEGLGVRQSDPGTALRAAASLLSAQDALLILDDCSGAPLESGAAVASLLEACPSLRVLVTARLALGAIGERPLSVAPLSEDAAVALYREFARTGDAESVRAICDRLGGNPFALGVVASAPGAQSLDALVRELEGISRPEYLLQWRLARLDPAARALLPRLAVFRGGWSAADAGAVCGEPGLPVAQTLRDLSDARLVVIDSRDGAARFRLPRTVREFAVRELEERGEHDALSLRHAEHFAGVVTAAHETWQTAPTRMWVPALERELRNLRAALQWSIDQNHAPQTGARIAQGSSDFWTAIGLSSEGAGYLLALLEHPGLDERTSAALQIAAARLLLDCARPAEARVHALRAAEYARKTGDSLMLARATHRAAIALVECGGEREGATLDLQQALELYRQARNRQGEAEALIAIAISHHSRGEFDPALERYTEALHVFRAINDEHGTVTALSNIGALYYMHGDFDQAVRYFHECAIRREQDVAMFRLDFALGNLGEAELARGNIQAATALLGRTARLLAIAPNDWMLALTLTNIARVALSKASPRIAVLLAGFSDAILTQPRQPTQDRLYRAMMNDTEMQLGGEAYQRSYADGRALSAEAALDIAAGVVS